jgi:hypothetical protein
LGQASFVQWTQIAVEGSPQMLQVKVVVSVMMSVAIFKCFKAV